MFFISLVAAVELVLGAVSINEYDFALRKYLDCHTVVQLSASGGLLYIQFSFYSCLSSLIIYNE